MSSAIQATGIPPGPARVLAYLLLTEEGTAESQAQVGRATGMGAGRVAEAVAWLLVNDYVRSPPALGTSGRALSLSAEGARALERRLAASAARMQTARRVAGRFA